MQEAQKQLEQSQFRIRELYHSLVPEYAKAQAALEACSQRIAETESLYAEAEKAIESIKDAEQQEKDKDAAANLARSLQEGSPCPVCGALHHPSPAQFIRSGTDYGKLLQVQQRAKVSLSTEMRTLAAKKESLAQAQQNLEQLVRQVKDVAGQEAIALSESQSHRTIAHPEQEVQAAIRQLNICKASFATLSTDVSADIQALYQEKNELSARIQKQDREITEYGKLLSATEQNYSAAKARSDTLQAAISSLQGEYEKLHESLTAELAASRFADEQAVAQAALGKAELLRLQEDCRAYHESCKAVLAKLETCTARAEDIVPLSQQLDRLQQSRTEVQRKSAEDDALRSRFIKEQENISGKQLRIQKYGEELEQLNARHRTLIRLYSDISSNNPKKMPFDVWVLRVFLEDVVAAANLRFRHISSGRYAFVFKSGGKELDLAISDSYTGKSRDTESLSGGELFIASLSLALALTDVVQQKSGGTRLDSLFIDEGFGSLDNEILDNTVSILNEVQEQRMVGIISHVESLIADIPRHIVVTKTANGSTISM